MLPQSSSVCCSDVMTAPNFVTGSDPCLAPDCLLTPIHLSYSHVNSASLSTNYPQVS